MSTNPNQALQKQPTNVIEYIPAGDKLSLKLSVQIVKQYLVKPTRQGVMPTDGDCMKFMMLCRSRALNPFEGDAFLVGYDGKNGAEFSLITSVQAFYKRSEVSADYDGIESGIIVQNEDGSVEDIEGEFYLPPQKVVGGWAKVYRKDQSRPVKERIRLSAFKKDSQFWARDEGGMIAKCAEAAALRRAFPTKLGGLFLPAEVQDDKPGNMNIIVDAEPVPRLNPPSEPAKQEETPQKPNGAQETPSSELPSLVRLDIEGFWVDWAAAGQKAAELWDWLEFTKLNPKGHDKLDLFTPEEIAAMRKLIPKKGAK